MYADDPVIYFSAHCCQNIEYRLNADLTNVVEWINNNYQTSNTLKCKFVSFGGGSRLKTCQGIKLVIDHENLESEDLIKYLVVVIHKNVTWNEHIWAYRIINCESEWKDWLVKSYETSIAFGCASRIRQCFNKTSPRFCWYHLGRQR